MGMRDLPDMLVVLCNMGMRDLPDMLVLLCLYQVWIKRLFSQGTMYLYPSFQGYITFVSLLFPSSVY